MERRKGKKEKEGEDLGRGRGGKGEGREGERGRALILEILEYPYNTVYDRWNEASMPKASCIHSVVSIQYRRVTDRQIQTHDSTIKSHCTYNGQWVVTCFVSKNVPSYGGTDLDPPVAW